MLLDQRASYLALHDTSGGKTRKLALFPSFQDALVGWTAGSRVSPIWRISMYQASNQTAPNLAMPCEIIFLGPVRPARLGTEIEGIEAALGIWATLGCFNIMIQTGVDAASRAFAQRLIDWALASGIAYEHWTLDAGIITHSEHHILHGNDASAALAMLGNYANTHQHPAVRSSYQENLVATATSLARAAAVYPSVFDEIEMVAEATAAIMEKFSRGELTILEMQSRLLAMNAALSRFSSQAFSGVPPIQNTECHFWIHSLLGTGSANLALASLVASIQKILGEARLPERLRALEQITVKVPTSSDMLGDDKLLNFDILRQVEVPNLTTEPIVPLVTYFSGRDGFSSHVQTLSAPLTTLAECNSLRSNLLTVTHEVSHIFVQSALAELSPTPGKSDEFAHAHQLLTPQYQSENLLDAARKLFLEAVVSMAIEDRHGHKPYSHRELASELAGIIERTRAEVQEILVHTFDFLYFHAGEPAYYVSNIWHSWCSIPGISDRVPEYLMRTLCAVSSNLLRESPQSRFAASLRETKRILQGVEPQIGIADNYVAQVLAYIDRIEANSELYEWAKRQYGVRMRLVRLVRIFLFSDTLAAELFHDPYIGGGDGYKLKKPLAYDTSPIGNALQFLRTHLKANPSEAESLWVLHGLAFDSSPPSLGIS